MERRSQERDIGLPNSYNPPQITQESPVKLPLAPILSTPPDRRANAVISSARRGSSIFSPAQSLNQPFNHPSQQHQQLNPPLPRHSPDPEPPPTAAAATASGPSNPKNPAPAPPPPPPLAPPPEPTSVRYRECLKNHAASMGGHVVDGCGEFMPSGDDGTPEALRCAACDCHRNFHRREEDGEPRHSQLYNSHHRAPLLQAQTQMQLQKHTHSYPNPPAMVNFGGSSGGAAAESSSEDLKMFHSNASGHAVMQPSLSGSKKRFRTKFSQEQKDRMHEFASKIGWRIQKQVEQEVQQFCNEVGVKRKVFKVWMHNNKQAMKKAQT